MSVSMMRRLLVPRTASVARVLVSLGVWHGVRGLAEDCATAGTCAITPVSHRQHSAYHPVVVLPPGTPAVDFSTAEGAAAAPALAYSVGRWDEVRPNMYTTEHFDNTEYGIDGYDGLRNVHMGLDLGAPAGSPVCSLKFYERAVRRRATVTRRVLCKDTQSS